MQVGMRSCLMQSLHMHYIHAWSCLPHTNARSLLQASLAHCIG